MFTAYLIDKAGFTMLGMIINGRDAEIPQQLYEKVDESNYEAVLKRLADIGYIHVSAERINIERTVNFLVSEILGAERTDIQNGGKRVIFYCKRLIIIVEEYRLSPKKCRLIPIKDESMLKEYLSQCDDKFDYMQEE